MTKTFSTLAVMGVYTGFLLKEHGFNEIHEVMDHFYPGIMTLGVAAMSKKASQEVARQLPGVTKVKGDPADWKTFANASLEALGPTLKLDGPIKVSDAEVDKAFDDFAKGMRR